MSKGKVPAVYRQRVRVEFDVFVAGDRKDFSVDTADFAEKVKGFVRADLISPGLDLIAKVDVLRFSDSGEYIQGEDRVTEAMARINSHVATVQFADLDPEVDEYHPF